ncbi:hypothetical protein Hanom_Chr15g01343741 [Helianthus anomalus]
MGSSCQVSWEIFYFGQKCFIENASEIKFRAKNALLKHEGLKVFLFKTKTAGSYGKLQIRSLNCFRTLDEFAVREIPQKFSQSNSHTEI